MAPGSELTEFQRILIESVWRAMTGYTVDLRSYTPSIDYLRLDWFELAPQPLDDVRARFNVMPKSDDAVAAGSVGPWQPGGMSPFQERSGRELAERDGRPYESYGATTSAD